MSASTKDGSDPRVLDIIDIPVLEPQPKDYQTENWLLDPKYYWVKVGRASSFDLSAVTDPVASLWINGYSTFHGRNDKILLDADSSPTSSLRLLHAINLKLPVFRPDEAFGNSKRRVQGQFTHLGTQYALWVTDPAYERAYLAKLDGTYDIGECYLTISIGGPYKGACYKLIATIIQAE